MKAIAASMLLIICVYSLSAQTDSLVYLDEVEILGSPVNKYLAGTVIQTIRSGQSGALDQLADNSSIYFKEYGNGQLSTITLRGTSASHTNVLWNGLPVNSPTLGQTDFTIWPMFLVDDLAIQKGSGSSSFGSGSIGGSIILDNSVIKNDSLITLYTGVGSFGQLDLGSAVQLQIGELTSETRLFTGKIQNNFPYELRGEEVRQEHASVDRLGVSQRVNLAAGNHFLFAEAAYARNDRQIQPTITSTSRDVLLSENLRFVISDEIFSNKFRHFISVGYTWDQTVFNEVSTTGSHQIIGNYAFDFQVGKKITSRLGMTAIEAWATSGSYSGRERQNQIHLFSSWNFSLLDGLLLSLNLREAIHDENAVFAPSIGGEWTPLKSFDRLKIRGQVGRGYRVPTFNDLFWNPGGNPDLLPEFSINYEAGIDLTGDTFSLGITGFVSDIDQWIQWIPTDGIWSPLNIRNVNVTGVEVSSTTSFSFDFCNLSLHANYEYTRSRDLSAPENTQLPYVPRHSGFTQLKVARKHAHITGRWNYTGERFNTLSNSRQGRIDDFGLLDIIVGQSFDVAQIAFTARISANNVFDTGYENVINTAMPGRNYLIELTIRY